MKLDDEEFKKALDKYVAEQFAIEKPKPNSMIGSLGWYNTKRKEFIKQLEEEKK